MRTRSLSHANNDLRDHIARTLTDRVRTNAWHGVDIIVAQGPARINTCGVRMYPVLVPNAPLDEGYTVADLDTLGNLHIPIQRS